MTPAPNMCSWDLGEFTHIVPFSSCIPGRARKVGMIGQLDVQKQKQLKLRVLVEEASSGRPLEGG